MKAVVNRRLYDTETATLGGWYDTIKGRKVQVKRKEGGRVVLLSKCTGHEVPVGPDYPLRPFYETFFV